VACSVLAATSLAHATSYDFSIDMRAVDSNGRNSYLDGGQGKLRYDEDDSGLHLGRLRAAINQPLGEVFALHAEASSWGDRYKNPIDFTEAYLEYKPYPVAGGDPHDRSRRPGGLARHAHGPFVRPAVHGRVVRLE
jgi:hypothetical protein